MTYFNVTALISSGQNVLKFQDRNDDSCVHNAFLVVEGEIISAISANVTIKPETLNLKSKGVFTAFITLPEKYNVTGIDNTTVKCECAPAIDGVAADDKMYIAKFEREVLATCVESGDVVELTVTGMLTTGETFKGSDTICVIAP